MKKGILTLMLSLVLALLMLPIASFANVFTESPEEFAGPTVESVSFTGTNDASAQLILTSYHHRNELPADLLRMIEEAADEIRNANNVNELTPEMDTVAKTAGVNVNDLVVSDLFDLRATIDDWGTATVTLKSDSFENFVALLHYTGNGNWDVVDKVKEHDDIMTFTVDSFSPFAVVVNTGKVYSPQTGDFAPQGILSCAVLFGAAGLCFLLRTRKSAED